MSLVAGTLLLVWRWVRSPCQRGLSRRGSTAGSGPSSGSSWVAAPVAALLATLSDGLVVASAVEDASWTSMLQRGGMPWATLLAGIGVTSLARVMAHARVLQDDVDGLV